MRLGGPFGSQPNAGQFAGRYTSSSGAFRAGLNVDTDGLVIEYAGFWRLAAR
jgi:hypothetical protein